MASKLTIIATIVIFVGAIALASAYPSPITQGLTASAGFAILVAAGGFRNYKWQRIVGAGAGMALLSWLASDVFR